MRHTMNTLFGIEDPRFKSSKYIHGVINIFMVELEERSIFTIN